MFALGARSKSRLVGVHPDLIRIVALAITLTEVDFTVLEGVRNIERQRKLFAEGHSRTMNSMHLPQSDGTSHAVDVGALVGGKVIWELSYYHKINEAMDMAANQLGLNIVWGGDWDDDGDFEDESFRDGAHFQI